MRRVSLRGTIIVCRKGSGQGRARGDGRGITYTRTRGMTVGAGLRKLKKTFIAEATTQRKRPMTHIRSVTERGVRIKKI